MNGVDLAALDTAWKSFATRPDFDRPPMPPLPTAKIRNSFIDLLLLIDERGGLAQVRMTPPKDTAYAREFANQWRRIRFTAAKTSDGLPTKGYVKIRFAF